MTRKSIVSEAMGGWKWGYPRGHRYGLRTYRPGVGADGTIRWYLAWRDSQGLTPADWARAWSEAGGHCGTLHRKALTAAELAQYAEEQVRESGV